MSEFAKEILSVSLTEEMEKSYLDYAMSVIVARSIPDARDGLKPVHRRIMFSMHKQGNAWNKKYVKSAAIVGDVMGKYHPHGDSAIYESLVRLAQDFSLRYPLVDGQGNFGSIDGDSAAAHRYTEARMSRISHALLSDIEKDTVDFAPNYDGSQNEPVVLPSRLPNLLLNGSSGIAVGMTTNIPPHNLGELLDASIHLLKNPQSTTLDLMQYVKGPDFPTGGIINGAKGILDAYETGKGRIYIRAKTHFEEDNGKNSIVIDEIPYQVVKASVITRIAELIKDKRLDGISALRDESDKDGIRMVIELRRNEMPEVVLNKLFQLTALQSSYSINILALVGGRPRQLSLKDSLNVYLAHRREVITRRCIFELAKARERAHVLEGLSVALNNIDEMISLIKQSAGNQEAREGLLKGFWKAEKTSSMLENITLSELRPDGLSGEYGLQTMGYKLSQTQSQAILDLRLNRLTGLEQEKITQEFKEHIEIIGDLLGILNSNERLVEILVNELEEIRGQFNDTRRTQIQDEQHSLSAEDLIADEERIITLSHEGYIKAQSPHEYEAQKRGGKGKSATTVKDEDFVKQMLIAKAHDTLLCFSSKGKVYWLKAYEIPLAGRGAKGRPIVNMVQLDNEERLMTILPVRDFSAEQYVFFATRQGVVKKTPLSEFAFQLKAGKKALGFREDDELVDVALTNGHQEIMLFASDGRAARFRESLIRPSSRIAKGVNGLKLKTDQHLISLVVVRDHGEILSVTENGYGKRTKLEDYPVKGRNTQGVINIKCNARNGAAVAAIQVEQHQQIMFITNNGTLIRTRIHEIASVGRNTQGVRLIQTRNQEKLIAVVALDDSEDSEPNSAVDE